MQSSLPQDLVPIGSSTLLAIIATSCAIFNAVGQAVFQTRLQVNLSGVVPGDLIDKIIKAGSTDIRMLVEPSDLRSVIAQYSKSITEVFVSHSYCYGFDAGLTSDKIVYPSSSSRHILFLNRQLQVDLCKE